MTFKQWIFALIDSVIQGVAVAIIAVFTVVDSATGFKQAIAKVWIMALVGAILGLFNHLRQSPITKITGVVASVIVATILLLPLTGACLGPKIVKGTAEWDPVTVNTDGTPCTDLGGYFVYWKSGPGVFRDDNRTTIVGAVTTFNLRTLGLPPAIYIIAVSAYDLEGNESALSNEVSWDAILPGPPNNKPVKP